MGVQHFPGSLGALAEFLHDRLVRVRRQDAQVAVGGGVAGELMVVPEQPAQDVAPLGVVVPAVAPEALDEVVENDTRLRQAQFAVLEHGHLAHDVDLPVLRRVCLAVEIVDESRLPVRRRAPGKAPACRNFRTARTRRPNTRPSFYQPPVASHLSIWSRRSEPQKGSPSTMMYGEPKAPRAIALSTSARVRSFTA